MEEFKKLCYGLINIVIKTESDEASIVLKNVFGFPSKPLGTWRVTVQRWNDETEREALVDANEDKLQSIHAEEYNGTDDDMCDAYESWLSDLETYDDVKDILEQHENIITLEIKS